MKLYTCHPQKLKTLYVLTARTRYLMKTKQEWYILMTAPPHVENYVGQTKKPNKERSYEHHILTSKEATTTRAISFEDQETTTTATRRSQRNTIRHNYAELDTGSNQRLTPGDTAVSRHIESTDHKKGDVTVKILCRESNKWKRWVKESIWIHRLKPTLNETKDDSFKLPVIWHDLIHT